MTDKWLDQLRQIREADKVRHEAESKAAITPDKKAKVDRAAILLHRSQAHELLRQVQKVLLGGQGTLDILSDVSDYERVVTLVWQGPVSAARRPNPEDPQEISYLLVGVRQGKLWVNGQKLASGTPEALKKALVMACEKPGRAQRGVLASDN
jgi:hypothetical protein